MQTGPGEGSRTRRRILYALTGLWATSCGWLVLVWNSSRATTTVFERVWTGRAILVVSGIFVASAALIEWPRTRKLLIDFFTAPAHPVNLAIFRIAVFSQVYRVTYPDYIATVAALPEQLQFPPSTAIPAIGPLAGMSYWPVHPLGPDAAQVGATLLLITSIAALVGFFTRFSALAVAVLFLFVWGIPQWFGKVDHHHHLFWFALLLAASRCGDALSIDSLVKRWRAGGRGQTDSPSPAIQYRLPLSFAMLLMGMIYFFPGFWKMWVSGLDWALSDNLVHHMHAKWHLSGGWLPPFRLDRYPVLYQGAALGVMLFELTFVFLIFGRRTRVIAAFGGLAFHFGSQWLMQIGFETLRNLYVVFLDWHRIFRWIGGKLYRRPITATAAYATQIEMRWIAVVRGWDLFDGIDWQIGREATTSPGPGLSVRRGDEVLSGRAAWRAIAWRVVLLLPALPFLYLPWPRADSGRSSKMIAEAALRPRRRAKSMVVSTVLVGGLLVIGNLWAGATQQLNGWPLASYPTFQGIVPNYTESLEVQVVSPTGDTSWVQVAGYRDVFGDRWNHLLFRIIETPNGKAWRVRQLRAVWSVLAERDPSLETRVEEVRFYVVKSWVDPARWSEPPGDPRLIFRFKPFAVPA